MTTTSTHDSKRGEDAAARIAVLSEVPELWERTVGRLREIATPLRRIVAERAAPEPALEYLFYQTLVGVWPFGANARSAGDLPERASAFLLKAAREAKTETSWLTSNAEYEAAVGEFAAAALRNRIFVDELCRFSAVIDRAGATNALSQTLLRLCVPGVPDTYQGSELWHQSLVDPDNRRPVDYERRRRYLAELDAKRGDADALAKELLETYPDGRIKQYVIRTALALRRAKPELFLQGDYLPLESSEHAFAFARVFAGDHLLCVVPRLIRRLAPEKSAFALGRVWADQSVRGAESGRYRNVFTDDVLEVEAEGELTLSRVFASFPVALLVKEAV
jgi:(1->4)-alpha-D-glucan 1-alpha-D-glucosylmutase